MCRDGLRDFKVVARAIMHGSTWEWFEAEKNTCSSRCDQVFFHLTKKNADKLVYLQKKNSSWIRSRIMIANVISGLSKIQYIVKKARIPF